MMQVACLYDIHGNLPALEAVLAQVEELDVDQIVIGGDVVAGPLPSETLARLKSIEQPCHFIIGNAEAELLRYLDGRPPGGLTPRADEDAAWVAEQLSDEDKAFVASWKDTVTIQSPDLGAILFCHATPHSNIKVFTKNSDDAYVQTLFEGVEAPRVVCGHTHMQYERTVDHIQIANSGSVGMPFGETGAHWLLLTDQVNFEVTHYDKEAAAERVRQSNYPSAEAFATGNILSAPSAEQAMGFLTQIEERQRGES